jgi:hypothetical protein
MMVLTGTSRQEVYMRVAVFGFLSGLATAALPLAANAVPTGPDMPAAASSPAIEQVAGGCGPGWHPVPGHFTPWGHWVPPHCAPHHYWWP